MTWTILNDNWIESDEDNMMLNLSSAISFQFYEPTEIERLLDDQRDMDVESAIKVNEKRVLITFQNGYCFEVFDADGSVTEHVKKIAKEGLI